MRAVLPEFTTLVEQLQNVFYYAWPVPGHSKSNRFPTACSRTLFNSKSSATSHRDGTVPGTGRVRRHEGKYSIRPCSSASNVTTMQFRAGGTTSSGIVCHSVWVSPACVGQRLHLGYKCPLVGELRRHGDHPLYRLPG